LSEEKVSEIIVRMKKDAQARRYIGRNGKYLLQALEDVRSDGYAIYNEEVSRGMRAIAVPVFSPRASHVPWIWSLQPKRFLWKNLGRTMRRNSLGREKKSRSAGWTEGGGRNPHEEIEALE